MSPGAAIKCKLDLCTTLFCFRRHLANANSIESSTPIDFYSMESVVFRRPFEVSARAVSTSKAHGGCRSSIGLSSPPDKDGTVAVREIRHLSVCHICQYMVKLRQIVQSETL